MPVAETYLRGAYVHRLLPVIPWAMLRLRNEHSRAFRGRYSPENSPWGVEIAESQYWSHVRTVDVIAPPQSGKTFHVCEMPTLYDLCESRETVFYMNGSEDNAKNLWRVRWLPTLSADPVLSKQLQARMDGGEWYERHLTDGGLLYSTGPQSAAALSQRESRIIRCSELEKTPQSIGNEASAYALARDRAAAYPATHMITSDCTITVRQGLSWIRFLQGDRSRPFIPCPCCGHYAAPVTQRHIEETALGFTDENTHLFTIHELALSSPEAASESVQLLCRKCNHNMTDREFRAAARAVVWVPRGCHIVRTDDPATTPIPKVSWLDSLNRWAAESLADYAVEQGQRDPSPPPKWKGPRLPDGVELAWTPEAPATDTDAEKLPAFRADPRKSSARSFWNWRIFAPKYTLGQVAREIVAGELGATTGDVLDDQKNVSQKCFVLPWVEPILGASDDLNEQAVMSCINDLPSGIAPEKTIGLTRGIDIGDNEIHWVLRAWTSDGCSHLVDHGYQKTTLRGELKTSDVERDVRDERFRSMRRDAIYAGLDSVLDLYRDGVPDEHGQLRPIGMTYIDSGYMSEDVYHYCAQWDFSRMRPIKGRGNAVRGLRSRSTLVGLWNDSCEKKALECFDATGHRLRHQYFEPKDPRRLMFLEVEHWKREVQTMIQSTARANLKLSRPGQAPAKAVWSLHTDLYPTEIIPGTHLLKRDRYLTQCIAERWGEWEHPKTKIMEKGWKFFQDANHLQDAECYAIAAAAGLGLLQRYTGKLEGVSTATATTSQPTPIPHPQPRPQPSQPMHALQRPVRRSY